MGQEGPKKDAQFLHPPAEDVCDLGLPVALRLLALTLQPLLALLLPL